MAKGSRVVISISQSFEWPKTDCLCNAACPGTRGVTKPHGSFSLPRASLWDYWLVSAVCKWCAQHFPFKCQEFPRIVARVVQPYSRFSRKLDHELVDCTKKHQFPLHTSINNNKPFASTAGSWFPTFSLKQISSIEVSLICSICHIYSHILPMFSHGFPMLSPCFPPVAEHKTKARGDAVLRFREETRKLLAAMTAARRTFRLGSHWQRKKWWDSPFMVRKNYHFLGDGENIEHHFAGYLFMVKFWFKLGFRIGFATFLVVSCIMRASSRSFLSFHYMFSSWSSQLVTSLM